MDFMLCSLFIVVSYMFRSINSNFSDFNYEKINRYGLGRRIIPNYRRLNPNFDFGFGEQHPGTLPPPKKVGYVAGPYQTIYQGKRKAGDYRAYRQNFDYSPVVDKSQRYHCEARLPCIVSHMAMRTEGGIPILLRGGVGYRHFYVVARAYAGTKLNGTVTAYCMRDQNPAARRYQYGPLGRESEYYRYT